MASNGTNSGASGTTHGYIDSAVSTVKNAVNSVVGSNPEPQQQQQQQQQDNGTQTQPSGTYNQTLGSAKQTLGSALGNDELRRAGEEQNARGEEEEARRQVKDWGEGVENRVKGKVGEVLSAGDPDPERNEAWRMMHEEGKSRQKGTEEDIDRRWG